MCFIKPDKAALWPLSDVELLHSYFILFLSISRVFCRPFAFAALGPRPSGHANRGRVAPKDVNASKGRPSFLTKDQNASDAWPLCPFGGGLYISARATNPSRDVPSS